MSDSSHQWTSALYASTGDTDYIRSTVDVTTFTDPETNPTGSPLRGYQGAWWSFVSAQDTSGVYVRARNNNGQGAYLDIWEKHGNVWTLLGQQSSTDSSVFGFGPGITFVAGTTYYVRIATRQVENTELFFLLDRIKTTDGTPEGPSTVPSHQWTGALYAKSIDEGYPFPTYRSTIDVSGATGDELNPTMDTLRGHRGVWWYFVSTQSISGVRLQALSSTSEGGFLDLWEKHGSVWTLIGQWAGTDSSQFGNAQGIDFTTGTTYYVRVAVRSLIPATVTLSLDYLITAAAPAPPPAPPAVQAVEPVTVGVSLRAPTRVGGHSTNPANDQISAPPVTLTVSVLSPTRGGGGHVSNPANEQVSAPPLIVTVTVYPRRVPTVAVPAIAVCASLGAASSVGPGITLTLTQPEAGEVVLLRRPQFIVAADQDDDDLVYTIEVQYADNPAFTGATTLGALADDGGVTLTATADLSGIGYWRARAVLDGDPVLNWSPALPFSVDTSITAAQLPVRWTAQGSAPRPIHLWHFDPPGPAVGELVTAYGHGFAASGRLLLGGDEIPVESWQLVAASPAATTDERVIDGDVVDPEHYEVRFYAPQIDPPGGPLTVEA